MQVDGYLVQGEEILSMLLSSQYGLSGYLEAP